MGYVVALILGGLVTWFFTAYQADRTEQNAQITKFVDSAGQIDSLVTRVVAEVDSNGLTSETRNKVRENIKSQYNQLESLRPLLGRKDIPAVNVYENILADADDEIRDSTNTLNAGKFMQSMVDLATERPRLYATLKRPRLPIFD